MTSEGPGPDAPGDVAQVIQHAMALQQMYVDTGRPEYLTPAIDSWRFVIAQAAADDDYARFFGRQGLGLCLHERYTHHKDEKDLDEAIEQYEEIVRSAPDSDPRKALVVQYLDVWLGERGW
jgi:hypothetical protein